MHAEDSIKLKDAGSLLNAIIILRGQAEPLHTLLTVSLHKLAAAIRAPGGEDVTPRLRDAIGLVDAAIALVDDETVVGKLLAKARTLIATAYYTPQPETETLRQIAADAAAAPTPPIVHEEAPADPVQAEVQALLDDIYGRMLFNSLFFGHPVPSTTEFRRVVI